MHPLSAEIREYELEVVRRHFPPAARVLELGAGNGLQARRLSEWGLQVVKALDVDDSQRSEHSYFDVDLYDGVNLPLANDSVDVVYSSNVFEHVQDVAGLLAETRRVLAPGGRCVHVLPSPVWRGWTLLTRFPFLVQLALHRRQLPSTSHGSADAWEHARERSQRGGPLALAKKALVEPPHGEFPSAVSELHHYRASVWRARFEANGFRVTEQHPAGLFYTGYGVSRLSIPRRERMAAAVGSSCTVFVLEPTP